MSNARLLATILGFAFVVIAAVALTVRYTPIPSHPVLYLVVASPYLIAAGPLAVALLAWGHRWVFAVVAAVVSAALVAPQVPWFVRADPLADHVALRAMTINMLYGRADPVAIVRAADEQADVVMVQEFTQEAADGLAAAGIRQIFPYEFLDARPEATGIGLYSRHPITQQERIGRHALPMVSARIRVDGVARDTTLLSVHLAAPWPQPIDDWKKDLADFPATLADVADHADGGAILVGGDFNATTDMQPFRDLLANGYRDAAEQAGAGFVRTYPANRRIPSFMGIDHVLTRDCTATSAHTLELPGTDHRAFVTTIQLRRD
ncbi:endonuclease/exonuclease/phosphatase family protein [Mycolicibacterium lacusdiani]|uniref:endonuclease/exonuclease/phosphatase family protein n=1 Tax=Mycolicibacterium lacusdiani TaxID=2895283 RepID=UPI001F424E25|nr:endonuclease/exonuclease/phosphatase family protein [Mycolicibacterium lacusdiani]